jgi:hypothetical protein
LFLLLTTISLREVMAGSCGSGRCNVPEVTQNVQHPASGGSASHAFTAIGGSRVADVNLSQEALAVINAGGKEEPLPKGFLSAADRAKLMAKQSLPDGWSQEENGRLTRAQARYSVAARASRNSRSAERRPQAKAVKPVTVAKVTIAAKAKSQN